MAKRRALPASWICFSRISRISARAAGSIISAVAALEMNSVISPVASMMPSAMRWLAVPSALTIISAMRRCRFHFSMASASTKPPMYMNTTGWP